MKYGIIFLITVIFSLNTSAQKIAKVSVTTTTTIADALDKCKEAGKLAKYGSKEYSAESNHGQITLWKNYAGGNANELQIQIEANTKDGKTVLTLRMPHLPNTMGSYTKELKKYVAKLHLPDMTVGDYWEGIE